MRELGTISLPYGLQFALLTGACVTPGLIAYDLAHQGPRPTLGGLAAVVGGTLLITVPVLVLANVLHPESSTQYVPGYGDIPPGKYWLATLASVFFCVALRLSFALRAGGFIGALFLTEMLSVAAFVTVIASALFTHAFVRIFARRVVLTPRQEFQVAMLVGMMVAWTSLYWATAWGWGPALGANAYALEPLLAVGLIASDMGRRNSSAARTVFAVTLAVGFIWLVLFAATADPPQSWLTAPVLLIGVPALLLLPGLQQLRATWVLSIAAGRGVGVAHGRAASSGQPDRPLVQPPPQRPPVGRTPSDRDSEAP